MNFNVRFIGSVIKYFIYLLIILIAAGAALFWFDTGSWLVQPLAEKAGNFFLDPLKIEIKAINGSVRNGYSLDGLRLISGDKDLFVLNHASVSPDWDLVLSGMNGLPFIKSLNVRGISSDLDSVMALSNHFASPEDENQDEEEENSPLSLEGIKINPANIAVQDIFFGTPYADLLLDELSLNEAGRFLLNAEVVSGENVLPLRTSANVNFSPLEIISSDILIGNKGSGKFSGTFEPLKLRLDLTALSLEEFMQFSPSSIDVSGRIDGRIFAESRDGSISASGIISMPRAEVMNIPLNFRLPFGFSGSTFTLDNAVLNTKAAGLNLSVSGDIEKMKFAANGEARNISLSEIGSMFAPEIGLRGENGYIKFNVDTQITDNIIQDIFTRTKANALADIPGISAMGINAVENLSAHVKLTPNVTPQISMGGKIFGGKLFARAEAVQDSQGNVKPDGIIMSIVNLDIPSLFRAIPQLSAMIKDVKPSGKITATARVSDVMNSLKVHGKLTSDRLGAYGITLSGIEALMNYDYKAETAELSGLKANLGKGLITAHGKADLKHGNFRAAAKAHDLELKAIPDLRQVSGTYALNADVSGNYNRINSIRADAVLTARNAGYTNINRINADIPVTFRDGVITVSDARAEFPGGHMALKAHADTKTSEFRAEAEARNVDLRFIPQLKDVQGRYSLTADASGKYTDIHSIIANVLLNARNAGYSGMTFGNADIPANFRHSIITINGATASLPGGKLNLRGTVNIKNTSNPALDISASTSGINISQLMTALKLQDQSMPVSGKVSGTTSIKGNLSNGIVRADLHASDIKAGDVMTLKNAALEAGGTLNASSIRAKLRAENLKAAGFVNIPSALIDARGNMRAITIKDIDIQLNGSTIKGVGVISPNMKNFMHSQMDIDTTLKHLDLKALLKNFMEKPPIEGAIDARAGIRGSLSQPVLDLQLTRPILYGKSEINDVALKVRSPQQNHFMITAKARIDKFSPESDIDIKIRNGVVDYVVDTKPLDIGSAIQTQMPEMAGIADGFAVVHVEGSTRENAPILINAKSKAINIMKKIKIQDISLPVTFLTSKNRIEMKNGSAKLSGGVINSVFTADIGKDETEWKGNVKVSHLDFGKLAAPFMPEGELVGSVDAQVSMKGTSTQYINLSFAEGKFVTGPGYIHKIKAIENITPTKRISFEKINGSFFWNGQDLFLNPGTGARAGKDEPLYRYFTVNGSTGLQGKGLRLLCDGRFDLKILDQLLGAMKGVFQYMTGSLAQNVLRDAAGRVLGIKRRDFQNVSFTLANSWDKLHILNINITKPIDDFLPINVLNRDEEKQKDGAQFKLNLRIPTGPGDPSIEEESTSDQFKQQLIDNIFNIGR